MMLFNISKEKKLIIFLTVSNGMRVNKDFFPYAKYLLLLLLYSSIVNFAKFLSVFLKIFKGAGLKYYIAMKTNAFGKQDYYFLFVKN